MSKFEKAGKEVAEMAEEIMAEYATHKALVDARVRIDFVFAYADIDEAGNVTGPAIMSRGHRSLGVARKLSAKDRAMGRGDAEVLLDGDHWEDESVTDKQRAALLDHELHHFEVVTNEDGEFLLDSQDRPKLRMRRHDVEFGWFSVVAARHGKDSVEQIQAGQLLNEKGQYFWPSIIPLQQQAAAPKNEKKQAAAA